MCIFKNWYVDSCLPLLIHPGLTEGLGVVVHFPFMAFRCVFLCVCVLLCLHAGYKAAWCLGPGICADQTLLDSSPTHTNRSLSLVFLAGQHPFTLYGAWLMWPPLKCWYKIRLPCSSVVQSYGNKYLEQPLWCDCCTMSTALSPSHSRVEEARLADLTTHPTFPCRRLTMTVWLVAALSLFEIQAFEDSDTDTKSKWQLSCLLTVCCCVHVAQGGCSWFPA